MFSLRCLARSSASAAVFTATRTKDINEFYKATQNIWNVDFQRGPATTKTLHFHHDSSSATPLFHIMDLDGEITPSDRLSPSNDAASQGFFYQPPSLDNLVARPVAERMLRTMLVHNTMDKILNESQRQGRISFYMTMFGEEAAVAGAAAGLEDADEVFMQYREGSLLTYRGCTVREFVTNCVRNCECELKGRMMPLHYGSPRYNVQVLSSPLATQIPHGAGAGYAIRLENEELLRDRPAGTTLEQVPGSRICATFMGEGATSEGDFHAGLIFASTVGAHTLFFVRNNGYAISTPTLDQYRGDGIVARASGYGMPVARVDGSDILAVYWAVRQARELILKHNLPVVIEAFTYRGGHHSTSDDSTAYRNKSEMEFFAQTLDPIKRFEQFMIRHDWWDAEKSKTIVQETRKEVIAELRRQEKLPNWPIETLVDDVFEELTPHLQQQKKELMEHYQRHQVEYEAERL